MFNEVEVVQKIAERFGEAPEIVGDYFEKGKFDDLARAISQRYGFDEEQSFRTFLLVLSLMVRAEDLEKRSLDEVIAEYLFDIPEEIRGQVKKDIILEVIPLEEVLWQEAREQEETRPLTYEEKEKLYLEALKELQKPLLKSQKEIEEEKEEEKKIEEESKSEERVISLEEEPQTSEEPLVISWTPMLETKEEEIKIETESEPVITVEYKKEESKEDKEETIDLSQF